MFEASTALIAGADEVTSKILGFTLSSDVIDLKGFVATKLSFAGHTLTLDRSGGTAAHLLFAGTYHTSNSPSPATATAARTSSSSEPPACLATPALQCAGGRAFRFRRSSWEHRPDACAIEPR
jgi:hypothetical protein